MILFSFLSATLRSTEGHPIKCVGRSFKKSHCSSSSIRPSKKGNMVSFVFNQRCQDVSSSKNDRQTAMIHESSSSNPWAFHLGRRRKLTSWSKNDENFVVDEHNWRQHPSLTQIVHLPTIVVPSEHVHSLVSQGHRRTNGILVPFLASRMKEFETLHPKIKVVQNLEKLCVDHGGVVLPLKNGQNNIVSLKAILLDPQSVHENNPPVDKFQEVEDGTMDTKEMLSKLFPKMSSQVINELAAISARQGPVVPIKITYEQQTIQYILEKLLPTHVHPPPTGFEQIGHVIHLNLKAHHEPYKKLIGSIILDRLSPKIQTVVNKIGEVSGPYRVYDMDVLAGNPDTTVRLNEDGVSLEFDLRKVYWCTRLSGERKRLLEELRPGDVVADAFCGAGAFVVQAATKLGCTVYANDLNPDAVRFCRENAKRNLKRFHVHGGGARNNTASEGDVAFKPRVEVTCGDAFDFIQNLGAMESLPHHVVMNFPLHSTGFLGALRWWPVQVKTNGIVPVVHLYTFARGDNNDEVYEDGMAPRDATEVAVDLVAEGLVPEGGAIKPTRYRRSLLNKLGCDVKAREVRDVAPGKVVICVSFKVTNTLLRIMQGDFIDF